MVSLSRSDNTNAGGATFFSDSANMEEREYLQPILESYGIFKPINTGIIFTLHTLFIVSLDIAAIVLAIIEPDETSKCQEFFIIVYIHVALWFFTLILDQVVRMRHYKLRMNGYLDFYKKTQLHHRLPLYVVSLWNAAILLIQTVMQHYYPDDFAERCLKNGVLSPRGYICALITIEMCVLLGVNVNYLYKIRRFNKQKPPPDVQREEWNACSSTNSFAQGEIGYRNVGDKAYDFIEKQADLIRHLKDHNARLGEKLMVLNAQLQNRPRI